MKINNLPLEDLFKIRSEMILENKNVDQINELILLKEIEYVNFINEDTATGGPSGAVGSSSVGYGGGGVAYADASIGGMGSVISAQPSSFVGVTTEPGYSGGGGKVGSGDISVPYNPGGKKKVFQKIPVDNRKGSSKRRKNKLIQGLKNIFSQKQDYTAKQGEVKPQRIMNFDKFSKDNINKPTKIKDI